MASILVIKLSSLGDLFFALPAFQGIRRHHAGDHLVLLTAERFVPLMQRTGLFDEVWGDRRPKWWQLGSLLDLRKRLMTPRFTRVYDLQWSQRSDLYLGLLKASETFGATAQARRIYAGRRDRKPIRQRQAEFLAGAGITDLPAPDLSFLQADTARYGLPPRFALLAPGSSKANRDRRWPLDHYAALAEGLVAEGLTPVLLCGPDERDLATALTAAVPAVRDIDSNLDEIASLAREAAVVIGNDSGPTHLAALAGCPVVLLVGPATDPEKQRPLGAAVRVLHRVPLAELPPAEVLAAALEIARPPGSGQRGPHQ